MIRVTRRRIILAVLALFLVGVGTMVWTLAGLPPVRFYLRYGLDPYCEPTGAKETYEGIEFIEIGPGIFPMGSNYLAEGGDWLGKLCKPFGLPWGKQPWSSDEMPVHWVEFRRGFWIATTEVTNEQYERFKPEHERGGYSKGDDTPEVVVTWQDAKDYCAWVGAKTRRPIRLPSEAEWECACRAGSSGEFTFGDDEARLSEYAWFYDNSEYRYHAVATKRPNRWGLFDLHGNVLEWCEDTYHRSYDDAPSDGSARVAEGSHSRVGRGGSMGDSAVRCRSAVKGRVNSEIRGCVIGIRPAFSNPDD